MVGIKVDLETRWKYPVHLRIPCVQIHTLETFFHNIFPLHCLFLFSIPRHRLFLGDPQTFPSQVCTGISPTGLPGLPRGLCPVGWPDTDVTGTTNGVLLRCLNWLLLVQKNIGSAPRLTHIFKSPILWWSISPASLQMTLISATRYTNGWRQRSQGGTAGFLGYP